MRTPQELGGLVERFARNSDSYCRGDYKEAHVRLGLLNPFFPAKLLNLSRSPRRKDFPTKGWR